YGFDLRGIVSSRVVSCCHDWLHCKQSSGSFKRAQVVISVRGGSAVEYDPDPPQVRPDLLEQFHPFASERRLKICKTGDVAAWPRETANKAAPHRIGEIRKNDGNRACLLLECGYRWRAVSENDVGLETCQLLGKCANTTGIAARPPTLDPNVVAVH